MTIVRRFLIASSLVRLIRKERGSTRITEGYLAAQPDRVSYVRLEGNSCHLILITRPNEGEPAFEFTEVPRAQGEVLLDVCQGKVVYERVPLESTDRQEAYIDRFVTPGSVDLVRVEFAEQADADRFQAPAWFGPDVTDDSLYDTRHLALEGAPPQAEIAISNNAVNSVLDMLENRFGRSLFAAPTFKGSLPPADAGQRPHYTRSNLTAAGTPAAAGAPRDAADARIDDVFEELSRTLGGPQDEESAEDVLNFPAQSRRTAGES